jgi:SsrA-binding protein
MLPNYAILLSMKPYITNSKAGFNYETLETYEAGLVLLGAEVKALRLGHSTISESFIIVEDGALFLVKAYIAPYQIKNQVGYDPYRKRKILISKKELREIAQRKNEAGLTLIPLSLYDKHGFLKLQFALARGKNRQDKRNTIKDRDAKRDIGRLMKS